MGIKSSIYGPDGKVEQSGAGRPLLGSGEGGGGDYNYWDGKTVEFLGFNVTNQTKTIDGTDYKIVEAYCYTNFDARPINIFLNIAPMTFPFTWTKAICDDKEDVSPFTDENEVVYDHAYKIVAYAPASWTGALFQLEADFYEDTGDTQDKYRSDGFIYARRGSMGKNDYEIVGYDPNKTTLLSGAKPVTVTEGRLASRVLLGSTTDVTLEEEGKVREIEDETRFKADVVFEEDAYLGSKTPGNKVAKVSDIPDVSGKMDKDDALEDALASIFTMDTELASYETAQDVAIVKLTQLLGEDVSQFATT